MNHYPHHIGDRLKDSSHFSLLEHGVHIRLMEVYYVREKPYATEEEAMYLIGAKTSTEKAAVRSVLSQTFKHGASGFWQTRCDEEIQHFRGKADKASASANARWMKHGRNANAPPDAMRKHSEGNANQNQEPEPVPRTRSSKPPDAIASADAAKQEIWKTGRTLLRGEGKSPEAAGSFLGKLCKDFGQVLVLQAVRDAWSIAPAKPSEWLVARCQERRGNGSGNVAAAAEAKRRIFGEKDITHESERL